MASAGPEPWTLRLRGPKGTPAALELPQGGATTLAQLVALAGKATRVAAARLVLRAGFPPRELWPAAAAGAVTADSTVQVSAAACRPFPLRRRHGHPFFAGNMLSSKAVSRAPLRTSS